MIPPPTSLQNINISHEIHLTSSLLSFQMRVLFQDDVVYTSADISGKQRDSNPLGISASLSFTDRHSLHSREIHPAHSHTPVTGIPHVSGLNGAQGQGAGGSLLFLAFHSSKDKFLNLLR